MRIRPGPLAALGLLAAFYLVLSADPPLPAADRVEITIVHTNDLHGQMLPLRVSRPQPGGPTEEGGAAALTTLIAREREAAKQAGRAFLLLDAGDIFMGTPEGNFPKGRLVVEWMSGLGAATGGGPELERERVHGYDAMAVGNHEFDLGQDVVVDLRRRSRFPWLSANLKIRRDPFATHPFISTYIVKKAGVRIAIIGLTTSDLLSVTSSKAMEGVEVEKEEVALARVLAAERPHADVFVVLSHCGVEVEKRLAARFPEVDAIIGGHSHTRIDPAHVNPETGVLVAQAGSKGTRLGRVTLVYDRRSRRVVRRSGVLIPVDPRAVPADGAVEALIARYGPDIDRGLGGPQGEALGVAAEPITRFSREAFGSSALGNWLTDVMRQATGAEIAFHNRAGIRADIPAGQITRRQVYEVSPFGNTLVTMRLTGADVKALLESGLRKRDFLLDVSGLACRFDPQAREGARVRDVTVGGKPLDLARRYTVVTNSFLAEGKDEHAPFLKGTEVKDTKVDMIEAHAEDLRRRAGAPVRPDAEERLGPVRR